ncbi:MAG TPA: alpha-ketoglutarate-dependent dioxygenase AlkB [Candidatus Paceibacterota bacterium]|nr:alpha-ketoglutarate-dependent dioxygenase AlkB [Candidatus Paceibacterota bacterium]
MSTARAAAQGKLFDIPASLPNGLVYRPDFLTPAEEEVLIAYLENLPMVHPTSEGYEAKRRLAVFGWSYDFRREKLIEGPPLPSFLRSSQRKIAKWLSISPARVVEALVQEYTPGSAIGWHRDNEKFESIIGISLAGWCRMRFRPLGLNQSKSRPRAAKDVVALELEPRSCYIMQGDVRWKWQHSVAPVKTLRYSITFRTLPVDWRPD